MKKITTLLLAATLLLSLLTACGSGDKAPKYENLLVTDSTVQSSRFGLDYKLEELGAILTDDMLQMMGNLDYEITTGETYTQGGTEYPLRVIAMVTYYEDGEYITFTTQQLPAGTTLSDQVDSMTGDLGSDITFSGLQEITILGQPGCTFSLLQSYEDTTFYNVAYLVQNGDYLLTIMCSGAEFPDRTTESIATQLMK